jgi:hypothetical protein
MKQALSFQKDTFAKIRGAGASKICHEEHGSGEEEEGTRWGRREAPECL